MALTTAVRGVAEQHQRTRDETEGLSLNVIVKEKTGLFLEADSQFSIPFLEWAQRIPEPKTGKLNFARFPFQPAMYEAFGTPTREVVCRKATQVGISAMTVRWALYEADRNGRTVLYVFPTLGDVHDFSDARVGPMLEGSEYLLSRRGEPFNKGLKRLGIGLVYFRGSENKRGLDSVDGDCLALDEYDTLNQANIPDAERRLSSVLSAGLIRRVGVPSLPEFGIAEKYSDSDRRKWLVKCGCRYLGTDRERGGEGLVTPKGRGWQQIDYWDNVLTHSDDVALPRGHPRRYFVGCAGCGEPLNVAKGRWVAQNKGAGSIGFHVSRLIVPNLRLDGIVKDAEKTSPYEVEVFYNKDLGLPYVSREARLSPEDIAAAVSAGGEYEMAESYDGPNPVTAGIDVASERALNVRISELVDDYRKRALWIGEVDSFDELARLMDRFNVSMAAIDHLPEGRLARGFAERFPGRVFIISYSWNQKNVLVPDWPQRTATVRRVEAIDATVEGVRKLHNMLPVNLPAGYVSHMTSTIRRVKVDDLGRRVVTWEATRPDDYLQAEVYDLLAAELWWIKLQVDDQSREVLQPLDDLLEFQRGDVDDLDSNSWRPGPGDDTGASWE